MKKVIRVIAAALLLTACAGNEPEPSGAALGPAENAEEAPMAIPGQPVEKAFIPKADFTFDPVIRPLGREAHAKYLTAKVAFRSIPLQGAGAAKTAVVGSPAAKFYPAAKLKSSTDLKKLPAGVKLPLGAFLAIGSEIRDQNTINDDELNGLFAFEDNYNYFYETEYQGRRGLVFGADLAGLGLNAKANSILSFYYTRPQKSPAFYDYNGHQALEKPVRTVLERDRVAFEAVSKNEYSLSSHRPDDLVALYMDAAVERERSLFLTTDLFAHTLHLLFDRTLAAAEEERLNPALAELVNGFLAEITALRKKDKGDKPGYSRALDLAETYFSVPQALLRLAPEREVEEDYPWETVYREKDGAAVLAPYSAIVKDEIALIDQAAGYALSPAFGYNEDYSQYKPRGHYTKNGVLSAYFRAMIWFGRVHCYMSLAQAPVLDKSARADNAADASLSLTPVAVLIARIAREKPALYEKWRSCFDPVTRLIGLSDDLSLYDLLPALGQYPFGDFPSWADDPEKIVAFLSWGAGIFKAPRIADKSVFFSPSVGNLEPAAGFRLFGQRFTDDSFIHMQVSPPRLPKRDWVRGLDVMKVFGSRAAEELLARSDYRTMPGLKETLDRLEKDYAGRGADFWGQTYYHRTLFLIKSQAQFEQGQGFFFTETPAWSRKALLAAHGAWAELRHDTILYVKQVAAEAGGGPMEPTFRTIPVPRPIHYLEPNLYFFRNAYLLLSELADVLQTSGMFTAGYPAKYEAYATIVKNLLPIVEREIADRPISEEQNEYLAAVPAQLARLILPAGTSFDVYAEDIDQFRMALVADVYTNAEKGEVLETAVGLPLRMHTALNDGQGGRRVAVGYVYSYYEFQQPISDRLNDEQWKALVYAEKPDLHKYLPFWAVGLVVPQ